jgi:hypothetical protein
LQVLTCSSLALGSHIHINYLSAINYSYARKSQERISIVTAQLNLNSSCDCQSNGLAHPPTPPHHHHTTETFKALPGNPGSWFSVCSLILTQLDARWKKTSIFLKMQDDLNFFQMEDNLNFFLGNLLNWFLVCSIVSN